MVDVHSFDSSVDLHLQTIQWHGTRTRSGLRSKRHLPSPARFEIHTTPQGPQDTPSPAWACCAVSQKDGMVNMSEFLLNGAMASQHGACRDRKTHHRLSSTVHAGNACWRGNTPASTHAHTPHPDDQQERATRPKHTSRALGFTRLFFVTFQCEHTHLQDRTASVARSTAGDPA